MPKVFAKQFVGVLDGSRPAALADGAKVDAKTRVITAHINLADRAYKVGDTIVVGIRPKGSAYRGHRLIASATMGAAATLAIGTEAVPAKYRAAATFTAVETPTEVALTAQVIAAPIVEEEEIIVTIGAADLPAAGTLIVETLYSTQA